MIARYTLKAMKDIWLEKRKYETWLEVEILALEAYSKINPSINPLEIQQIRKNAKVNVERIHEIENETKHDVIAFTKAIEETLGSEKKWFHYGLTSTDIVDTAQSIRLKEANKIITQDLKKLHLIIEKLAKKHKYTYQIGRTHGIHAEVTTFGYKMALWFDEISRNLERFKIASRQIEVAKISGAVGTYASIPLKVQDYVASKLNLLSSKISTQTLQRDRHASYVFTLALIGSSLDKFATEIRHLQKTEVQELAEGFSEYQKGSSAMPHKKNPINCEKISGLARILRGFVVSTNENVALWHERDISHSSVERVILADATILVNYMITQFQAILENLVVNKEKMKQNIMLTKGVVFSQRAMLILIHKNNWSREKAYNTIQNIANQTLTSKNSFGNLLIKEKLFTRVEVNELYNLDYYVKNIDKVFKRLNLK